MSRHAVETFKTIRDAGRELDPASERARKDRAAADLSEFRLQVERDQYLPADEVERQKAAENSAMKAILMTWSATLPDQVGRAKNVGEIERIVDTAVREVLTELSDPERPIACPHCAADLATLPEAGVCGAPTRVGTPCKNLAGGGRCHLHRDAS